MDQSQQQFDEFLRNAGELSPNVIAAMAAISAASGPIDKMKYSMADAVREVQKFNNGTSKLTETQAKELQMIVGVNTAFGALQGTLKQFGSALMDSSTDMTKFGSTIRTMGDGAKEVGNVFGTTGKIIGTTVKYLSVMAEAVLKYNGALIKAYDDLATTGATINLTTTEIRDLGAAAGYSTKTLGNFVKTAKSLDTALVNLGGSTSGGIKAFGQISAIGEEQYIKYKRLGYSQEQVTEMQAKYVKQTAESGGALAKTPLQLQKESLKYIDTLNVLAEITGVSAKKQQESMELALQQENVNAYIYDLERKRAESTDQAERERLQRQIESTKATAANIVATNDASNAAAKLQSIATDSGVVFTENNAKLAISGQNYDKINEMLRRGEDPALVQLEMMKQSANAAKNFRDQFGESAYKLGSASKELQDTYGITNKVREQALAYEKYSRMSEDEKRKYVDDLRKKQEAKGEGKGPQDKIAEFDAQMQSYQRKFNLAMDKAIDVINPFTGSTMAAAAAAIGLAAAAAAATVALSRMAGNLSESLIKDILGSAGGKGGTAGNKGGTRGGGRLRRVGRVAGTAAETAASAAPAVARGAGTASKLAGAGSYLGKAAGPVAAGLALYEGGSTIYEGVSGANKDLAEGNITKGEATVKKSEAVGTGTGQVAGGIGGAALGGKLGTAAGGAIGALFGGVGAVPGAIIGGLIGTAIGGFVGSNAGEKIGQMAGKEVGEKLKESDSKSEKEMKVAEEQQRIETEKLDSSKTTNEELQTLSKNIDLLNKTLFGSTKQLSDLTKSITSLNSTIDFNNDDAETQIKKFEEIANKLGMSTDQMSAIRKQMEQAAMGKEGGTGGKPMSGTSKEFYDNIYKTLLEEAKKAKVANPEAIARLGAAQSSLETGYGKSLAGGNNYFGIKAKQGDANASMVDTQEWDPKQGKYVTTKAGFRKYGNMQESAADYIKFLQENPRYKDVLNAKTTQEAIQAQGKTGYATDPSYANKLASINNSSIASPSTPSGTQTLADAGLKFKKGDVQAEGASIDPRLIEIAKQVQAQVPGFIQFTGFNDQFHQENSPGSLHTKGKAFDFVVGKKPSKEEGSQIVALMKSLGIDYAIDEYNNPSAKSTAGHFHGQLNETMKAYDGGIFDGPKAGYNVELHGREAIVPLPNPDSVISVDEKGAKKDPLSTVMDQTNAQLANIKLPGMDQLAGISEAMMKMMEEKFDSMISKLESSVDVQEKIYRNSAG